MGAAGPFYHWELSMLVPPGGHPEIEEPKVTEHLFRCGCKCKLFTFFEVTFVLAEPVITLATKNMSK